MDPFRIPVQYAPAPSETNPSWWTVAGWIFLLLFGGYIPQTWLR